MGLGPTAAAFGVSMTTASTLLSFGTMPFNIWLYSRFWMSGGTVIPYVNIIITLASILFPVIVGMITRRCSLKAAKVITLVGSVSGLICVFATMVMQLLVFPSMLEATWQVYVAASMMPVVGFSTSYLLATICRRPANICRTISFETGCQNLPMAVSIIALSFTTDQARDLLLPPLVYGSTMVLEGMVYCGIYRLVVRLRRKEVVKEGDVKQVSDEVETTDELLKA